MDARSEELPFGEECEAHRGREFLGLRGMVERREGSYGMRVVAYISTPRYVFTLNMLAAPPATTSVVAMLNALSECSTPLKLPTFAIRSGAPEDFGRRMLVSTE